VGTLENRAALDLNFDIWILIADLHHKMLQVRQKEVGKYGIYTRQLFIKNSTEYPSACWRDESGPKIG
jgi:hypothetical protein